MQCVWRVGYPPAHVGSPGLSTEHTQAGTGGLCLCGRLVYQPDDEALQGQDQGEQHSCAGGGQAAM